MFFFFFYNQMFSVIRLNTDLYENQLELNPVLLIVSVVLPLNGSCTLSEQITNHRSSLCLFSGMLACATPVLKSRSFDSTLTQLLQTTTHTHTHAHRHTQKKWEAEASLAMMRTGSCHCLSIPSMSPMARNKLVTALPATLSGYLRCAGLAPLSSLLCIAH